MTKTLTNLSEIAADLANIRDAMEDAPLEQAMQSCTQRVLESFDENFQKSANPDGVPWPPRKRGGSWPLLIKTGALHAAATGTHPASIKRIADRDLAVGVDKSVKDGGIPGAAVHNFGYPPRNIPQREYLRPRSDALEDCGEIIADAIDQIIG